MSPGFRTLPGVARVYITAIVCAGSVAIAHSLTHLTTEQISNRWLVLAVLTVLTGSLNLKIPSINAHLSVSESFVFASILLFGTPAGTATVLVECLVISLWMKPRGRTLYRVVFNAAAPSLAIWIAGTGFYYFSGLQPYSRSFTPLATLFLPFLGFIASYFILNSSLVAIAVALEQRQSPIRVWRDNFAWLSVNYFSGAYVAALIVTYTKQLDIGAVAIIVPLIAVSYLTFRTAIGRAQDSYNHLAELNQLYLSTIETLAMAIDAKDQITHGHIRRVQTFAVGLARSLGVTDEKLLKAIEAAALLHDMGKLAVPEHILNKPGKLTPAEFEKMKLHASAGAEILSAIDFPYPVVPMVRHHHENWNGTGYPDKIAGTDIPIGARILSVVDCFDALTSDRPYRPRLSDADAIAILLERRGTMYDPLIVDTFIEVHERIAPARDLDSSHLQMLGQKQGISTDGAANDSSGSNTSHTHIEREAAGSLGRERVLLDLSNKIKRHIKFSLLIFYTYDVLSDELVVAFASGEHSYLVNDMRIQRGERLSGWVAANRRSIVNSDPALDLLATAGAVAPPLRTTLSVPIIASSQDLLGVLTLYSSAAFFSDDHRLVLEHLGPQLAQALQTNPELVPVRM